MSLDEQVEELIGIVRKVLELNDDAPITPMRLRQAVKVVGNAHGYVEKCGRILDQWRALMAQYDRLAVEADLEPSDVRFPDLVADYAHAMKAFEKAVPVAKHFYFFEEFARTCSIDEAITALQQRQERPRPVQDTQQRIAEIPQASVPLDTHILADEGEPRRELARDAAVRPAASSQ